MQVTLIENRKYHVHHEHRHQHEDGQVGNRVLKRQRLTLQRSLNSRRQNLLGRRLDKLGCRANRIARLQVEEQGHASELVDVVDRLGTDYRMRARHRVQRNHALAIVTLDVKLAQILGPARSSSATSRITWY